jgi:hypothetical protein
LNARPEAYLQPDRNKDCSFYSAAYVARCLGFPDVTADDVKAWRSQSRYGEVHYAPQALGADMLNPWQAEREGGKPARDPFWLGPRRRSWVETHLDGGWIAQVMVNRIASMGHAVALLGHSAQGVRLMDPIYGHMTEPWGWFLGPGSKAECADWPGAAPDGRPFFGCHYIEGWYRMPVTDGVPA